MKKVLLLLLMGVMLLGAKSAMADAKLASQQGDARLIDNVDLIFMGYANKVVEYQNVLDFRLNGPAALLTTPSAGTREWGGLVDGKHTDLGVIGIYVNRPVTPTIFNAEPATWSPTGGAASWFAQAAVAAFIGGGASSALRAAGYTINTPANNVDIFYGKSSDNSNFGIHINYGDSMAPAAGNTKVVDDFGPAPDVDRTTEQWARKFGASIGLGFKDAGAFSEVDIHAGYTMGMFRSSVLDTASGTPAALVNDVTKDNGVYTITAGVLAQKDLDKDTNMRMFADAVIDQLNLTSSLTFDSTGDGLHNNATDDDYQLASDFSRINVALGLGCNHKVNDGAAVVSSGLVGGFTTTTMKARNTNQLAASAVVNNVNLTVDQADTTNISAWWNASVDAKVASWINVRAGIRSTVFNRTTTKSTNNTTYVANAPTNVVTSEATTEVPGTAFSCGFGIHWQNWVLNANVTAQSLANGIASPQPGGGILFPASGGEGLLVVNEADLAYTF